MGASLAPLFIGNLKVVFSGASRHKHGQHDGTRRFGRLPRQNLFYLRFHLHSSVARFDAGARVTKSRPQNRIRPEFAAHKTVLPAMTPLSLRTRTRTASSIAIDDDSYHRDHGVQSVSPAGCDPAARPSLSYGELPHFVSLKVC